MTIYRIFRNNNRKLFVETTNKRFALQLYKEGTKAGDNMEIKEKRGTRFFKLTVEN